MRRKHVLMRGLPRLPVPGEPRARVTPLPCIVSRRRSSIAKAEEGLGEISAKLVQSVGGAMERARAADAAGDKSACEQALAEVEKVLGP